MLIKDQIKRENLRSNNFIEHRLVVPFVRKKSHANRAFSVVAPRLWNQLPDSLQKIEHVDVFKAKLKTELFVNSKCYWI